MQILSLLFFTGRDPGSGSPGAINRLLEKSVALAKAYTRRNQT